MWVSKFRTASWWATAWITPSDIAIWIRSACWKSRLRTLPRQGEYARSAVAVVRGCGLSPGRIRRLGCDFNARDSNAHIRYLLLQHGALRGDRFLQHLLRNGQCQLDGLVLNAHVKLWGIRGRLPGFYQGFDKPHRGHEFFRVLAGPHMQFRPDFQAVTQRDTELEAIDGIQPVRLRGRGNQVGGPVAQTPDIVPAAERCDRGRQR